MKANGFAYEAQLLWRENQIATPAYLNRVLVVLLFCQPLNAFKRIVDTTVFSSSCTTFKSDFAAFVVSDPRCVKVKSNTSPLDDIS